MYRRFAALFLCLMVVSAQHHLTAARGDENGDSFSDNDRSVLCVDGETDAPSGPASPTVVAPELSDESQLSEGQKRLLGHLCFPTIGDKDVTHVELDLFKQYVNIIQKTTNNMRWSKLARAQETCLSHVDRFFKKMRSESFEFDQNEWNKYYCVRHGSPTQSLKDFVTDVLKQNHLLEYRVICNDAASAIFDEAVAGCAESSLDTVVLKDQTPLKDIELAEKIFADEGLTLPSVVMPEVEGVCDSILYAIDVRLNVQEIVSPSRFEDHVGRMWQTLLRDIRTQDCDDLYRCLADRIELCQGDTFESGTWEEIVGRLEADREAEAAPEARAERARSDSEATLCRAQKNLATVQLEIMKLEKRKENHLKDINLLENNIFNKPGAENLQQLWLFALERLKEKKGNDIRCEEEQLKALEKAARKTLSLARELEIARLGREDLESAGQ